MSYRWPAKRRDLAVLSTLSAWPLNMELRSLPSVTADMPLGFGCVCIANGCSKSHCDLVHAKVPPRWWILVQLFLMRWLLLLYCYTSSSTSFFL